MLILDEPTNHLDIASREALENALLEFDGTIIAVSHDRYFINKLATRIFDMGGGFADFKGSYEEYLSEHEKRKASGDDAREEKTATAEKEKYMAAKKQTSDIRRLKSRMERNEARISELEQRKTELEKEAAGDAATNYVRLSEIDGEISKINDETDRLYADYDEAEKELARLEQI